MQLVTLTDYSNYIFFVALASGYFLVVILVKYICENLCHYAQNCWYAVQNEEEEVELHIDVMPLSVGS